MNDGSIVIKTLLEDKEFLNALNLLTKQSEAAGVNIGKAFEGAQSGLDALSDAIKKNESYLEELRKKQEAAAEKITLLKTAMTETRTAMEALSASIEAAKKGYDDNSAAVERYKADLTAVDAALAECGNTLKHQKEILAASESAAKMLGDNYRTLRKELGESADETKRAKEAWEHSKKTVEENRNAVGYLNIEYRHLSAEQKTISTALKDGEKAAKSSAAEMERLGKEYEKGAESIEMAGAEIENISKEMSATSKEISKHEGIVKGLSSEWKKLEAVLSDASSKFQALGKKWQDVGGSISNFTAPLKEMGAAAIRSALEFESAFAGIRKTVDATEAEYAALERGIREMSQTIPASAAEIAKIGEAAGQLGIEKENILAFSRTIADLGESTNLAGEYAASTLAQFANITQMPQTEFDRLGSAIVGLGNNFATTEADIAEMAMRLAGAGKQAGMSEAEILAFATALSSVGINAEAGGSAFSKVFKDIQLEVETGGAGLKDFADVAGMSVADFSSQFREDAAGAVMAFVSGLSDAERTGKSTVQILNEMGINEVILSDALLRASGASDVFSKAIEIGNKSWTENTALTKEAEQRYQTLESRAKIAKNNLVAFGLELTDTVAPAMSWVADTAIGVAKGLTEMARENPGIAALAAHLGAVAIAAGPAVTGIGKVVESVGKISGALSKATGLLPVLFNPLTAAIAGVAVVSALAVTAWDAHQRAVENNRQTLIHAADALDGFKDKLAQVAKTEDLITQWKNQKAALDGLVEGTMEYAEAAERLKTLGQELAANSDGFITAYEAENGIRQQTVAMLEKQMQVQRDIIELEKQQFMSDFSADALNEQVAKLTASYETQKKTLEGNIALRQALTVAIAESAAISANENLTEEEKAAKFEEVRNKLNEVAGEYGYYFQHVAGMQAVNEDLTESITKQTEEWKNTGEELVTAEQNLDRYNQYLGETTDAQNEATEAMGGGREAIEDQTAALEAQRAALETHKALTEQQLGLWNEQVEAGWLAAEALDGMALATAAEREEMVKRVAVGESAKAMLEAQVEDGKKAADEWANLEDQESIEAQTLLARIDAGRTANSILEAQAAAEKNAQKATEDYCKAAASAYDDYYSAATDVLNRLEAAEQKHKDGTKKTYAEIRQEQTAIGENNVALSKDFDNVIAELERKEFHPDFMKQMEALGPEQIEIIRAWLEADETEIARMNDIFETGSKDAIDAMKRQMGLPENAVLGSDFIDKIAEHVENNTSFRDAAAKQIAEAQKAMAEQADALQGLLNNVGENLTQGVIVGIVAGEPQLKQVAVRLFTSWKTAFMEAADEHSPSKVAAELGKYLSQGVAVGVDDGAKAVQIAAADIAEIATSTLAEGIKPEKAAILADDYTGALKDGMKAGLQDAAVIGLGEWKSYGQGMIELAKASGADLLQANADTLDKLIKETEDKNKKKAEDQKLADAEAAVEKAKSDGAKLVAEKETALAELRIDEERLMGRKAIDLEEMKLDEAKSLRKKQQAIADAKDAAAKKTANDEYVDAVRKSAEKVKRADEDFLAEKEKSNAKIEKAEKDLADAVEKTKGDSVKAQQALDKLIADNALAAQKEQLKDLQDSIKKKQEAYAEMSKAITAALKEQYTQQRDHAKEALKDEYDAQKDALDKMKEDRKAALDAQIDAVKTATTAIIEQYQKEYDARLKTLDADESAEIKALQDKIDAIDNLTASEDAATKAQQNMQKLAELAGKVQQAQLKAQLAETQEERDAANKELIAAQKSYDDEAAKQQRDALLAQRKAEQASLKEQITQVKANYKEQKDLAKEDLTAKKDAAKAEQDAQLENLKTQKDAADKDYKDRKDALDTHLKDQQSAIDANYKALTDKQRLEAEATKMMVDGDQKAIVDLLNKYTPDWAAAGQNSGEAFLNALQGVTPSIEGEVSRIMELVNQASKAQTDLAAQQSQTDMESKLASQWQSATGADSNFTAEQSGSYNKRLDTQSSGGYETKQGDTVEAIARNYGTTTAKIRAENSDALDRFVNWDELPKGIKLKIPVLHEGGVSLKEQLALINKNEAVIPLERLEGLKNLPDLAAYSNLLKNALISVESSLSARLAGAASINNTNSTTNNTDKGITINLEYHGQATQAEAERFAPIAGNAVHMDLRRRGVVSF